MTTGKTVSKTAKAETKKAVSSVPTEEEIRHRAHELYLERMGKGIHGSSDQDWQKALKELLKKK